MTTQETADKLAEWILALLPDFGEAQAFPVKERPDPFPDLAVEIVGIGHVNSDPAFPVGQLAENGLLVRSFDVVLVVDPEPPDEAAATLGDMADTIIDSATDDYTAGGRFFAVGSDVSASFRPPYVLFDDGTRGRQVTLSVRVAEAAPASW